MKILFFLLLFLSAHAGNPKEIKRLPSAIRDVDTLLGELRDTEKQLRTEIARRANEVPNFNQARLTATSATPVTTSNVTSATVIYFTPYLGNKVSLYYRGNWRVFALTETSYTLTGLVAAKNYDIFAYRNTNGAVAIELSAAWTSNTARSTALTTQDGVLVKSGDATRKYVGTFRTNTASAANYDDSTARRLLWNYYNRLPRKLARFETNANWNDTNTSWRVANTDTANMVEIVVGWSEAPTRVTIKSDGKSNQNTTPRGATVGVGINVTNANSAKLFGAKVTSKTENEIQSWAEYVGYPGVGYYALNWIESAPDGNTQIGVNGATSTYYTHGILSMIEG